MTNTEPSDDSDAAGGESPEPGAAAECAAADPGAAASPAEPAESGGEPEVPVWAFLLIFLGAPLVMTLAALVVQWWEELSSSPLTIGLVVGHLVSIAGLLGAYLFFYRPRRLERARLRREEAQDAL